MGVILVNTSFENLNLGDFSRILGNHLEVKQLSQKPKNSILGRIFI